MIKFGLYRNGETRKDGEARADFVSFTAETPDEALALALEGANDPRVSEVDPAKPDFRRFSIQGENGRVAYRLAPALGNSASGVEALRKGELVELVNALAATKGTVDAGQLTEMANAIIANRS